MTTQTTNTNVPNESFYLERFKKIIIDGKWIQNGRLAEDDIGCEIYKGFAIVTWKQVWNQLNNTTRTSVSNYVWEVGGIHDKLPELGWLSQGCITTGFGADTFDKALKKARKKVDLLAEMYKHKDELTTLSQIYVAGVSSNSSPVYNAGVGDVVAIRAFGRTRLGKIVKTVGSRFIVAYMTPSNPHDIHYKTLPLSHIYPKD